jgi:hypothetical protein
MRHLCVVAVLVALLATAAGQPLRINERASKVTLNGKTYGAFLTAHSTEGYQSAVIKLDVITPTGNPLASSSSPAQLKTGSNRLSASITLQELPKKSEDLLW